MLPPDEEIDWVRDSLNGDTEAFAAIVKQYQRMVVALAFRMTGSLVDAEDLAQELKNRSWPNKRDAKLSNLRPKSNSFWKNPLRVWQRTGDLKPPVKYLRIGWLTFIWSNQAGDYWEIVYFFNRKN